MPNIPGKLPQQTPFSIDRRDPYWQTRIFTPEAGALALEKIQSIENLQKDTFWTFRKIASTPSGTGVEIPLPEGYWWELIFLDVMLNLTAAGAACYVQINAGVFGAWLGFEAAVVGFTQHQQYAGSGAWTNAVATEVKQPAPGLILPGKSTEFGGSPDIALEGDPLGTFDNIYMVWRRISVLKKSDGQEEYPIAF